MVNTVNNLQFELSTGNLHADQACIERVEAGQAPRNLVQLLAMGKLLVDATASLEQSPNGKYDNDIVPLPEVILGEKYEHLKTTGYDHLDTGEWDMDDYIGYGRWLDSLTRDPQQVKTQLSGEVIDRASRIGIGPSLSAITYRRFETLTNYYQALDVLPSHQFYKYDSWSKQDLANYAEGVFLELQSQAEGRTGHRPSLYKEIERRAQQGLGPANWIFGRNGGGGVMKFMAMNGYADPRNMEPKDYIGLGVRIMRANDGRLPTPSALNFLALSQRSPTSRDVWTKFAWDDYLEQVQEAHEEQEALRKQGLTQKLLAIKQELEDGTLPRSVINGAPAMELIARRARWQVVGKLLPNLSPDHEQDIAQRKDADDFIAAIRCRKYIDAAGIEQAAKDLGVYEDIWPDAYMDYLRVPDELLARGHTLYLASTSKK
jgi:hypothetical protein